MKKNELLCGLCTEISASMWALYRKGTSMWAHGLSHELLCGHTLPSLMYVDFTALPPPFVYTHTRTTYLSNSLNLHI